jgi:hypothetical protein
MNVWSRLYDAHVEMRSGGMAFIPEARKLLVRLAEGGYCDDSIRGRFTEKKNGNRREVAIRSIGSQGSVWESASEPLKNLRQGISEAQLAVQAIVISDKLEDLTIRLDGKAESGRTWLVDAHLTGKHQGDGACSHALLHCHVGPTHEDLPQVRVPFPAVGGVGVLEWVISVAIQDWEPAPWLMVVPEKQ